MSIRGAASGPQAFLVAESRQLWSTLIGSVGISDGGPLVSDEAQVLSRADSDALFGVSRTQRVVPALAATVASGSIVLHEEVSDGLNEALEGVLATQLRASAVAAEVWTRLSDAGLQPLVIKGVATGQLDYENPAMRQVGDCDLYIDPSEFPKAISLLAAEGIEYRTPFPRGWWDIPHAIAFDAEGVEVDIHHRLLHRAAGHRLSKLTPLDHQQDLMLGDVEARALSPAYRLIVAAGQNIVSFPTKWSSDADVLRLWQHAPEAMEEADRVGAGVVLQRGMERAAALAELPLQPPDAENGAMARVLDWAVAESPPNEFRHQCADTLAAPIRHSARRLVTYLAPGADYRQLRGRTTRDQLSRQLSRLRGTLRPGDL